MPHHSTYRETDDMIF